MLLESIYYIQKNINYIISYILARIFLEYVLDVVLRLDQQHGLYLKSTLNIALLTLISAHILSDYIRRYVISRARAVAAPEPAALKGMAIIFAVSSAPLAILAAIGLPDSMSSPIRAVIYNLLFLVPLCIVLTGIGPELALKVARSVGSPASSHQFGWAIRARLATRVILAVVCGMCAFYSFKVFSGIYLGSSDAIVKGHFGLNLLDAILRVFSSLLIAVVGGLLSISLGRAFQRADLALKKQETVATFPAGLGRMPQ